MPCDHQASHMAQNSGHEHHGDSLSAGEQNHTATSASGCDNPGLCCLGSCMAPIALQSKALQDPSGDLPDLLLFRAALIEAPFDPHFRPPIAA